MLKSDRDRPLRVTRRTAAKLVPLGRAISAVRDYVTSPARRAGSRSGIGVDAFVNALRSYPAELLILQLDGAPGTADVWDAVENLLARSST